MQQRAVRCLVLMLYAAGVLGALWFATRFVLPFSAPFIFAYLIAALMERPVRFLVRHRVRRSAAAGMLTVGVLGVIVWTVWALGVKGAGAVTDFAKSVPELVAALGARMEEIELLISGYLYVSPDGVNEHVAAALGALMDEIYEIPSFISQRLVDSVARMAQAGPDTLLFIVTALLGTYFISASFPKTNAFIAAQLPNTLCRKLEGLGADVRASFGGFFRAQLILMCITFFELLAAFFALNVKGSALLAAITAVVDALPVFGTGTILVPWAAYELLLGSSVRALSLVLIWMGTNLVRSSVQAKLLGDRIGLSPLASLLAVYVGWRAWRVWGMLLFPIVLAVLSQLNEKGIIRLWRNV